MARRKKEPRSVHRENIASAASGLFAQKGVSTTSMDDIAQAAGYSKATLYVYFACKDEIVSVLARDSMKRLCACISFAMGRQGSTRARYDLICQELARYQEEYPFYFQMALETLKIDFEGPKRFPEEAETYQIGEEINEMLRELLLSGIELGELRRDMAPIPTAFSCWGMLSGLILLAANKADYIQRAMGLSQNVFLQHGFDMIYRSIANVEEIQ